jgi:hypothetical protein
MAESPLLYTFDDNDVDDDGTIDPTAEAVVESTLLVPAIASTGTVTSNLNQTGEASSKNAKARLQNFTDEEVDFLLVLIDQENPTCLPQWEYVTTIFSEKFKNGIPCTTALLKGKFKKLWSDKCPTGSANIPVRVKKAKRIYKDLMGCLSVSNLQVEQAEHNGATPSNMTNNNNGSEYPTMLDNGGVLQLPPVVDNGTPSFSKEASRVTTNRWTPK